MGGIVTVGDRIMGIPPALFKRSMAAGHQQLCIQNRADSGLERDDFGTVIAI
jgi:hypothetical protein